MINGLNLVGYGLSGAADIGLLLVLCLSWSLPLVCYYWPLNRNQTDNDMIAFTLYQTKERSFLLIAPVIMIVANTSLSTLLIAGRIWYVSRMSICRSATHSFRYMQYQLRSTVGNFGAPSRIAKKAVLLVIESGALYAAVQVCFVFSCVPPCQTGMFFKR
jgi:hypothetical protein